jgi:hypothetical protein
VLRYGQPVEMGGSRTPWRQEGDLRVAETTRGRVPMRGTGADRLVVVMKAL